MAATQHNAVDFNTCGVNEIIFDDEDVTTAITPGVALSVVKLSSGITSSGNGGAKADIATLADGVAGQIKIVTYKANGNVGDTVALTPAHFIGGTKITFDTPGQGCVLVFHGGYWVMCGNNGGVVS